jgi:16S rRNA (cytosine1402-N4)-methyltransferase
VHHDPVFISEIEDICIARASRGVIVDATLGLGGHAQMFVSHMSHGDTLIGIDRDLDNLDIARIRLDQTQHRSSGVQMQLIHSSFADIDSILDDLSVSGIDLILYDL